jgi:hypothetical protein
VAPFWEELETAETLSGLDQLTATLMRLWCLGQSLPAAALAQALDEETVAELVAARLLQRAGDDLSSPWRVVTFLQRHLLVTPLPMPSPSAPDPSPISVESLFSPVRRRSRALRRALDLSAGAGLLSVLAPGREVVAVELDPFAAAVARFNVSMGGHDHVSVVEGDLFGPVAGERFDLVIANPPFLPAPAGVTLPLCGDGGPTGDRVLQRILAGVEETLLRGPVEGLVGVVRLVTERQRGRGGRPRRHRHAADPRTVEVDDSRFNDRT